MSLTGKLFINENSMYELVWGETPKPCVDVYVYYRTKRIHINQKNTIDTFIKNNMSSSTNIEYVQNFPCETENFTCVIILDDGTMQSIQTPPSFIPVGHIYVNKTNTKCIIHDCGVSLYNPTSATEILTTHYQAFLDYAANTSNKEK